MTVISTVAGNEEMKRGRESFLRLKQLLNRDKASLDIFWLRDESLEESDNLPDLDVLAEEIVVLRLAKLRSGRPRARTHGKPLDRVEGSTISKPPSNNSAKSLPTWVVKVPNPKKADVT